MNRSFIGDTDTRRKSEDGFRENYVQAIYIIDNMSHAIGDVFIKSLFMEFIMNNLREADFMNWLRKVKK